MNVLRIVAVMALLTGPVGAQTLIQSFGPEKTPQQKADDELKEKFSKEQSKRVPEAGAKTSVDPWGTVRSGDAAKTSTSKASASKAAASRTPTSGAAVVAKPSTRSGTTAD